MPQTKLFTISLHYCAPIEFPAIWNQQDQRWEIFHPLEASQEPIFLMGRDRKLKFTDGGEPAAQVLGQQALAIL